MVYGYEDWDFWIKIAKHGARAYKIHESLFLYRKHGKSMIDSSVENHEKLLRLIKSNHRDVFDAKETDHFDIDRPMVVRNGNINLTSRRRSLDKENKKLLVAMPYMVVGGVDTVILRLLPFLTENGYVVSILTTLSTDSCLEAPFPSLKESPRKFTICPDFERPSPVG